MRKSYFLSTKVINRMDGCSNIQETENFRKAIQVIFTDLYEEDMFEMEDILAYFNLIIEQEVTGTLVSLKRPE